MRVLAVLPLVPYPPDQGDRLRAWEMLTALAAHGSLTAALVVPDAPSPPSVDAIRALPAEVRVVVLPRLARLRGAVAGALAGRPPAITAWWDRRAAADLQAALASPTDPWDLACAFQFRAAPYVRRLPARVRALEMTDALGLYRRQLPWSGRALRQRLALRGVEALERRWPRDFDRAWIAAEADAAWVERLSGSRPTVVPNGCLPVSEPAPYRPDGPVLFLGNMRYPPNEDAALWLAREVWPAVRTAAPAAILRLVGVPSPAVAALAGRPGVEVAGRVPDVAVELAAASVVVNPVRFGTGTNRKVLDAWAAARPVVSTPTGVRGFPCADGQQVLLASTPDQWVARLGWIREHPAEAGDLGRRGWRFAQTAADSRAAWAEALAAADRGG